MSTEIDQKNKPETTKTRLTRTSAYPGRKMGREVYLKFPQSEMLTRVCRKSAPWPAVEPSDTRGSASNSTGKYRPRSFRHARWQRQAQRIGKPAIFARSLINNEPLGGSSLFSKVTGKMLPAWASEFGATTWAQFFLKFMLANPAIVPGTNKAANLNDNLAAGRGAVLTATQRQKMIDYWDTIG